MTTPSIRLIRESFPEANLTFLTERPSDQVLRENNLMHIGGNYKVDPNKGCQHCNYLLFSQHPYLERYFFDCFQLYQEPLG